MTETGEIQSLPDMENWVLSDKEKEEFEEVFNDLQSIWENNEEYFNSLRKVEGIRSTQVMTLLAREMYMCKLRQELFLSGRKSVAPIDFNSKKSFNK